MLPQQLKVRDLGTATLTFEPNKLLLFKLCSSQETETCLIKNGVNIQTLYTKVKPHTRLLELLLTEREHKETT